MEVGHSFIGFTSFKNAYPLAYKLLCSLLLFFYNLNLFRHNLDPNLCYGRWYGPFLCSTFIKFRKKIKWFMLSATCL